MIWWYVIDSVAYVVYFHLLQLHNDDYLRCFRFFYTMVVVISKLQNDRHSKQLRNNLINL